jgi:hypothetical protein
MKADKNFKFPRQFKYMLSKIRDDQLRAAWKRSYIEATLAAEDARRGKYIDIFSKNKGE